MSISLFGRSPKDLARGLKRVVQRQLSKPPAVARPASGSIAMPASGEDRQGDANRTLSTASQAALDAFLATGNKLTLGGTGEGPLVSLIVVLFNKAHLTFSCLQHLQQVQHSNLEIIIVDNNSTDQTSQLLNQLDGRVKVLQQAENLHFLRACNLAFEHLHPESCYVGLVNNDALLSPSCIYDALKVFERWPDTGIVGGQILHLDGKLQEAGSVIFRDASCRGLGRRQSPWQPLVQMRRKVDYVSGCFLVIETALLRELGGFDLRFAPAYYEETDLCVSSWKRGRPVVYEPKCLLHHVEFASAGQTTGQGQKEAEQLMQKNQRLFREKHQDWLNQQHESHTFQDLPKLEHACRTQAYPYKILWIDDKLPNPAQGAGFGRLNEMISGLADLGCFITLFATDLTGHHAPPDRLLNSLSADYELQWGGLEELETCLEERLGFYTHIVASRRHNQELLLKALDHLDPNHTQARPQLIADVESLFSIRNQSQKHLNQRGHIATAKDLTASKDLTAELAALKGFNQIWSVSELEAELLKRQVGRQVHLVGHAFTTPAIPHSYAETEGLLFMGALNYPGLPNLDSLAWLAGDVLPLLRQQEGIDPEQAPLTIIGPYSQDLIKPLLERLKKVWPTIHLGPVPDVTPLVQKHRVVLAPTRFAAGLPHKVQHSIALGSPVVTTELIASQMGWSSGEGLMASNDAAGFAKLIAQIYCNQELWNQVQTAGLAKIRRDCDAARLSRSIAASLASSSEA